MFAAVRKKAFTWNQIDLDLCHHMVSVDHNELGIRIKTHVCGLFDTDLHEVS